MKNKIAVLLCCVFFSSFSEYHDYYLSTTTIRWVPEKQQFQLTSRFFLEDIESLMQQKIGKEISLSPDNYPEKIEIFTQAYYLKNIQLTIDGEDQLIRYLGREYQDELLVVYAEINRSSPSFEELQFTNTFLIDYLKDQQNIFHVILPDQRKSFLLTKEMTSFSYPFE